MIVIIGLLSFLFCIFWIPAAGIETTIRVTTMILLVTGIIIPRIAAVTTMGVAMVIDLVQDPIHHVS